MTRHLIHLAALLVASILCMLPLANSFQSKRYSLTRSSKPHLSQTEFSRRKVCVRNDFFGNFNRFWGREDDRDDDQLGEANQDADAAAGTSLITSIPVQSMKPGGLRLFLMFYCMGMQNTPDQNSWRADQPSGDEYIVEMLYHDATGMITIELKENEVQITRCGTMPSNSYVMQEAVIVNGVLDELHQCAFDESVDEADRLLIPETPDAIDIARSGLAFG